MLVTELKSLDKIANYDVDLLIIPTSFCAYADIIVSFDSFKLLSNKHIALKVDKIISEDEIESLDLFIKESLKYNIDYYLFTDMSVYYLLKKYNISSKGVYFSKTINCSTYDIKKYNELGIKCLVSTELTIDDLDKISNIENNFIYTYGYFNILYSKRKLLTLYKNYSQLDFISTNHKYTLLEETRKEHYPIIENNNGTFIFSSYAYLLFTEIKMLNKNNFYFIDGTFIPEETLFKIIKIYKDAFNTNTFLDSAVQELKGINNNVDTSFLYKKPEILKESKNDE